MLIPRGTLATFFKRLIAIVPLSLVANIARAADGRRRGGREPITKCFSPACEGWGLRGYLAARRAADPGTDVN